MNNGGDAAEQVVRLSLEGFEVAARLSGSAADVYKRQMIISREYIGTQTVAEAFVPIISEDIRKKIAEGLSLIHIYGQDASIT